MGSEARGLLPYAATALLLVAGTVAALVTALGAGSEAPPAGATPAPSLIPGAAWAASEQPRIAYWRVDEGRYTLWAEDLGGARRSELHDAGPFPAVGETVWRSDGRAVSYISDATAIVIVTLEGAATELAMPLDLSPGLVHGIADHRWSPDGRLIAATVRRADGELYAYVVDVESGRWSRAADLRNAGVGPWIGADELLIETTTALLAIASLSEQGLRPFTALNAGAPIIGRDGRIHFIGGDLTGVGEFREGSVYSATGDGGDLRREAALAGSGVVALAPWSDDRYLLGLGGVSRVVGAETALVRLPRGTDTLALAPDERTAIAFTATQIVELDVARLEEEGPGAAARVLLDETRGGAVWYGPPVEVVRGGIPAPSSDVPPFRSAFGLGRSAWVRTEDGTFRHVLAGDRIRVPSVASLSWAADGRLLTWRRASNTADELVLLSADGISEVVTEADSFYSRYALAPTRDEVLVTFVDGRDVIFPLERGAAGRSFPLPLSPTGSVVWTQAGILFIDEGVPYESSHLTVGHSLWRVDDGARFELADAAEIARLVREAIGETIPADLEGVAGLRDLTASPQGDRLALTVSELARSRFRRVLLDADGALLAIFSDPQDATDESWSPTGGHLGYTYEPAGQSADLAAVVYDRDGRFVASIGGRFAGWTPDGEWFLVARPEGLFAHRLDLPGRAHFVSPIGVPVVTTEAR